MQWSPHNANFVYVTDLGLDQVKLYPYEAETGRFGAASVAFRSAPGEGPRHVAFHPSKKLAYIMHELRNTVSLVRILDDGSFELLASASTLPEDFEGKNQGAHISVSKNGKYLYVSNRGLNSIAIFDLDTDGMMTLRKNVSTGGDWPRFFKLFDDYGYMLVANRRSGDINVFEVEKNGDLKRTESQLKIPHPTFIEEYMH